jgi:hypothetical protein
MAFTRFRNLAVYDPQPPPTDAEIEAIENALTARLPEDFKHFLAVANGGHIEYEVEVEHSEGKEQMLFCELFNTHRFPSNSSPWGTFLGELAVARENFELPPEVLPVARDGGGSLLFLDLTQEGAGRIVAFVHGLPAWTGRRQTDAFVEVAPSFVEYVDKLFISEEWARELLRDASTPGNEIRLAEVRELLDIGMPEWRSRLGLGEQFLGGPESGSPADGGV